MIKMLLKNGDITEFFAFPCTEQEMTIIETKLKLDGDPIVDKALSPRQLSGLEGHFVDLDELNYLAKRMESFDQYEKNCFLAIAKTKGISNVKDLINLTFNTGAYVLISDFSDMESIGRKYILATRGGISSDELEMLDLEQIGQNLLSSGKGELTGLGALFKNEEWIYEEPYDGENFPPYYYKSSLVIAELTYNGKIENLYLPDEDIAIDKAVKRLGAEKAEECSCDFTEFVFMDTNDSYFEKLLKKIKNDEGIYGANIAAAVIDKYIDDEHNMKKLIAIIEHSERSESRALQIIDENFNDFIFIKDAENYEDIGRYYIDEVNKFEYDPELDDYIDFEGYGERVDLTVEGEFVQGLGYICYDGLASMKLLFGDENEELTQTM